MYTVSEIIQKLKKYNKKEFHIHHTWSPDLSDFHNWNHYNLQEAMRNYHIYERGFPDIAQHVTQFPDGKFLIGRDFENAPASSKGYRPDGSAWNQDYVFMIENVGNFDKEPIPDIVWKNNVQIAAYFVANGGTVRFHNQMDPSKSCPGTKFDYAKFMTDVKKAVEKEHWADRHRDNLIRKGIVVFEERYDDPDTRGETFALLDRITDDYQKKIDLLQIQLNEIQEK